MDELEDGITHVNVYSRGFTELGRFLSNFTQHPVKTEDGPFESIEGYWYWLSCKDDALRTMYGFQAKKYGRSVGAVDWMGDEDFKRKICEAIKYKILNSDMIGPFLDNELPLKHYYVYSGRIVEPKEGKWIIEYIEKLRKDILLVENQS